MNERKFESWRRPNPHVMIKGGKSKLVNPTRIFDQLSFIGTEKYACFVLETLDGYVMFDCLACEKRFIPFIEEGFEDLGLDIRKLKSILITHGHGDHYGYANYFREHYGAKIYMSETDFIYARDADDPYSIFPDGPLTWPVDGYLVDGEPFCQGGTEIQVVATPGHTYGCMSFIIPVTDDGVPHMLALWGGTGVPGRPEKRALYLQSCDKFSKIADEFGVDGELCNHPYVDMTIPRLEIVRNIVDGVPNPFVLGRDGYKYYEKMFRNMCLSKMDDDEKKAVLANAEEVRRKNG